MARDSLQIRIVTGEGLLQDLDFGTCEDLSEAEVAEAAKHFELAAVGSLLDFIHPEILDILLQADELNPALPAELATCWQGQVLEPGTAYGVLLGDEHIQDFAQRSILTRLKEQMSGDRFLEARRGAYSSAPQEAAPSAPDALLKAPRGQLSKNVNDHLRSRLSTYLKSETNSKKGLSDGHV